MEKKLTELDKLRQEYGHRVVDRYLEKLRDWEKRKGTEVRDAVKLLKRAFDRDGVKRLERYVERPNPLLDAWRERRKHLPTLDEVFPGRCESYGLPDLYGMFLYEDKGERAVLWVHVLYIQYVRALTEIIGKLFIVKSVCGERYRVKLWPERAPFEEVCRAYDTGEIVDPRREFVDG